MAVSLGIVALATVLATFTPIGSPATDVGRALTGCHLAFGVAAVFALTGSVLSWLLVHDADAAATMHSP